MTEEGESDLVNKSSFHLYNIHTTSLYESSCLDSVRPQFEEEKSLSLLIHGSQNWFFLSSYPPEDCKKLSLLPVLTFTLFCLLLFSCYSTYLNMYVGITNLVPPLSLSLLLSLSLSTSLSLPLNRYHQDQHHVPVPRAPPSLPSRLLTATQQV